MKNKLYIYVPIILGIVFSFFFIFSSLDIKIESLFYDKQFAWLYSELQPYKFLYKYGCLPSIILSVFSLFAYILISLKKKYNKVNKNIFLYLVLVMLIAPGLIVNTIFKQNWGRPRPRQIVEFGGDRTYQKIFVKKNDKKANSFPSGHAATAFYLLIPFFVLKEKRKKIAYYILFFGTIYGFFMGLARMLQGGHFPSDALWSFLIVYYSGFFIHLFFKKKGLL